MDGMTEARRPHTGWILAAVLLMLLVLFVLLGVSRGSLPGLTTLPGQNPSGSSGSQNPSPPVDVAPQPDPGGYEYRVTEERYVVLQSAGELQVQQRRRESWRASDGWTWARQTGDDPAQFIFTPDVGWQQIRRAQPQAADQQRVMRKALQGVSRSELANAQFNFVNDALGSETLPASSLPTNYRKALVAALARNDGVTVTRHVPDPVGRDSIRISLTAPESTVHIYLDRDYQYLAYTGIAKGSGESASKIVSERRRVTKVPNELLSVLGSERVEKAMWR